MFDRLPPGAGLVLWGAAGLLIAIIGITVALVFRRPGWAFGLYITLWVAALLAAALLIGDRNG